MKTFSWKMGVVLLAILALQGCSTNPSVSGGGSIEEFTRSLNGKRYEFDQSGLLRAGGMHAARSGELLTPQRIPAGLTVALAPAQEHCKRGGGAPSFSEMVAYEPSGQMPQRILCLRDGLPIWALEVQYVDLISTSLHGKPLGLLMTLRTQLLSGDQYAARLQKEQAQAQAQTTARNQAVSAQRERQEAEMVEIRRVAAQWSARVAAFQANVKVGDRFQWAKSYGFGGPFFGVVVRLEGTLAFVQFDSLTISGQPTRYLPKVELEPLDRPTPNSRRTID